MSCGRHTYVSPFPASISPGHCDRIPKESVSKSRSLTAPRNWATFKTQPAHVSYVSYMYNMWVWRVSATSPTSFCQLVDFNCSHKYETRESKNKNTNKIAVNGKSCASNSSESRTQNPNAEQVTHFNQYNGRTNKYIQRSTDTGTGTPLMTISAASKRVWWAGSNWVKWPSQRAK